MGGQYRIELGDLVRIREIGETAHVSFLYSGMPNDQTFALTVLCQYPTTKDLGGSLPGRTITTMTYYPKQKTPINVGGQEFKVVSVSPDDIILQFISDSDRK